jgi:hypothetical protein
MIDLHGIGSPREEPGAGTPRTRRRLPLRIAEIREGQAPPAPTPLPGHLCEACLDAPVLLPRVARGGHVFHRGYASSSHAGTPVRP